MRRSTETGRSTAICEFQPPGTEGKAPVASGTGKPDATKTNLVQLPIRQVFRLVLSTHQARPPHDLLCERRNRKQKREEGKSKLPAAFRRNPTTLPYLLRFFYTAVRWLSDTRIFYLPRMESPCPHSGAETKIVSHLLPVSAALFSKNGCRPRYRYQTWIHAGSMSELESWDRKRGV